MKFKNYFGQKTSFEAFTKIIRSEKYCKHVMSQGPPNPGFRSVKVENWDFLIKDTKDFKNSFQFESLCMPSKTEKKN
jgi:hypothetical protein